MTIAALRAEFTTPAWKDLNDPDSVLHRLLGGEHFKKSGFEILLFSSKPGNDYKVKVDPKELARYTIEYRKK